MRKATGWIEARQFAAQARIFGIKISDGVVSHRSQSGPIAGAHASVESVGELQKRITATRLLMTGPFALALKKKKDERQVFLTITGHEDSYEIVVELKGDPKTQASARQFAARFNSLAASSGEQP
jgi:hypothetical protein